MEEDRYHEVLDKLDNIEGKVSELLEEIEAKEKEIKQLKKERNIQKEIQPGTILHGFCNGYFDRDSFTDKVIEAIGSDWVVARARDSYLKNEEVDTSEPLFADFSSRAVMYEYLTNWAKPEWEQE